ncbi:Asp-tRNA(Asn)/Glu-tRNA(Gln) amidotransferase GatCAB subunit B [Candidatus Peregrinibacteria bacterium CG11_big_fil_rev_8_21_14_0_20_46_8]|nr:MAG: Asp-tRNA(Asn)/Glu-tRNA(Gln) amidotransferase GatCAB subunit B [Candidatus Peregrinibacteria bacterium CG11_big_fil_rev_8_21_14_0_20_46_8]
MQYEPVVGIEIHCQMNTATKMFCFCDNDSFGADPNTNVCPICMGFPGMLPAINEECVKKGILSALALNCEIPEFSKYDRKNYFYPDLPKGFQISQYDKPVSQNGYVDIMVGSSQKRIRINRLHLEDDAGKLTHVGGGTLCDYNRSGSPLMEIVTEADIRSVEEASAYAQEIQRIMRYVGSSDCDMEKGMMRFDINVSLRPLGEEKFGTKAEVKNLNSFRALEEALAYEIKRQTEILESGGTIVQETRGWDPDKQVTVSQRSKEEANDYRYFPEPDLPPLVVTEKEVAHLRGELPELPLARRHRFIQEFGLSQEDAGILTDTRVMADFFENVVAVSKDAKKSVAFVNTILLKHLKEDGIDIAACKIQPQQLGKLITLVNEGTISNNQAKGEVFEEMYTTGEDPEKIIEEKGLKQVSDTGAIEEICKKVIEANPGPAQDVREGKDKAIGFLVGMVMKESKGQANPQMVNEMLRRKLQAFQMPNNK